MDLDRAECLRLLGSRRIGRVVFTESALPAAQPVAYLVDDEEVVFATPALSALADATCHHVVAFEVDELDDPTWTGWSVLGVGEAYEILEPVRLAWLAERLPPPWTPGPAQRAFSIPLQRLTGRRVRRSAAPRDVPRRQAS